jgi:hypothetical protein
MSDRRPNSRLDQPGVPVPVSPALRRFAAEYFAAGDDQPDGGRRRTARNVRKQVRTA